MRYLAPVLAGLVVAACGTTQPPDAAFAPDRRASFVALVEQEGCQVDPVDHEFVHTAGFSDTEISGFSRQLVSQGQAELAADGTLTLMTGTCI